MNEELLIFGGYGIDEPKFHWHKNLILIDDVDINKKLISKKFSW